jgi:hypothetical protein
MLAAKFFNANTWQLWMPKKKKSTGLFDNPPR